MSKMRMEKTAPVKTTLNLVIKEKTEFRPERLIPALVLVLIVVALFAKFAIYDRYAKLNEAEAQLAQEKEYLENLRAGFADFDEVQEEYNRYTYAEFDRTIADRQDVLELLEKHVFPVSGMRQLSVSAKSVTMTLTGMTLDEISVLIADLESEPLVQKVFVSTTDYSGEPVASVMITLADATTLEGGAEE